MNNITDNELKTAIAYYRYSSHRQGEQSIEGQRDAAERWANENGYIIVKEYKEYIDRAQTGMNDKRESFQALLAELGQVRPGIPALLAKRGGRKRSFIWNKGRAGTPPFFAVNFYFLHQHTPLYSALRIGITYNR